MLIYHRPSEFGLPEFCIRSELLKPLRPRSQPKNSPPDLPGSTCGFGHIPLFSKSPKYPKFPGSAGKGK